MVGKHLACVGTYRRVRRRSGGGHAAADFPTSQHRCLKVVGRPQVQQIDGHRAKTRAYRRDLERPGLSDAGIGVRVICDHLPTRADFSLHIEFEAGASRLADDRYEHRIRGIRDGYVGLRQIEIGRACGQFSAKE